MHPSLYTIEQSPKDAKTDETLAVLESGKIIYLPNLAFNLLEAEVSLLSETCLGPKEKNISYDYKRKHLSGYQAANQETSTLLTPFMHRFATFAKTLIDSVLPAYQEALIWGRTSYRPAEINGRKTSKRKDDTRVHVDSFASTPVHGQRILRVFSNINPYGNPRVWQTGEPFEALLPKFSTKIRRYRPLQAKCLQLVKATKTLRSAYDHYMLHLHDKMKLDENYQRTLTKNQIDFPPNSTWIVFTDQVSHAALSGQFLLEQTFYLPVQAMGNPHHSPLRQWETRLNQNLI